MHTLQTLDDVCNDAAAGPELRRYLRERGIATIGTLALLAVTADDLDKKLVQPLMQGWQESTPLISLKESEKPIAAAILRHMWALAKKAWADMMQANVPGVGSTQAAATAAVDKGGDRVPATLPAGERNKMVGNFNNILLNGRSRNFPVEQLLGAEKVIAQALREHRASKLYTPIMLGEIIQLRSFTASGEINPLAKSPKKAAALHIEDGEVVQAPDAIWEPRSLLSLLDGLESAKWAHILIQLGDEAGIEAFRGYMNDATASVTSSETGTTHRILDCLCMACGNVHAIREDLSRSHQ